MQNTEPDIATSIRHSISKGLESRYPADDLGRIVEKISLISSSILDQTPDVEGILLGGSLVAGNFKQHSDFDFQLLLGGKKKGFHRTYTQSGTRVEVIAESRDELVGDFKNEYLDGYAPTIGMIANGVILHDPTGTFARIHRIGKYLWFKRGPSKDNLEKQKDAEFMLVSYYLDILDGAGRTSELKLNKIYSEALIYLFSKEGKWVVPENVQESTLSGAIDGLGELMSAFHASRGLEKEKTLLHLLDLIFGRYGVNVDGEYLFSYD